MVDLKRLREHAESAMRNGHGTNSMKPAQMIELLDRLEAAQKDAARYRYISNLKHIWGVLGDRYNLPAEENGAGTLDESIDLAIEEIK